MLRDQRVHAARRVDLVAQEVDMRQRLATRGLSTRVDLLDVQRRQAEARDRLAAVEGDIAGTRAGIVEARATLSELDAKLMADASERLAQVRTDLAEVERSLMQVADRARRTRLTAPVDGVVKGVDKRTPGAVLQPGDTVLEIVPISDEMVAEVRLDPKDAGHVRRGHTARVEITAYDTARFGDLNGEVRHVSASTFQDKDGRPYYRAIVALEKPFVGPSPQRNPVLPGMVVRAKIATGTKTLLSYLTKPVSRGFDAAFTER
jgi:HlyD family type I secretion membrane fusion protein